MISNGRRDLENTGSIYPTKDEALASRFISGTSAISTALANEVGIEKLCDLFMGLFCELFSISNFVLFFIDDATALPYLKRISIGGVLSSPSKALLRNLAPLTLQVENGQANEVRAIGDWITALPDSWLAAPFKLSSESTCHFFALRAEGRTKGLLCFPVAHNAGYGDLRIDLLESFCNQMAVSMDYVWLFEKMKHFNLELERTVEERTRELKAAQVQMFQREKMASLGQLTAGIAHEINNPLAFVINNATLVKESLVLRRLREKLAILRASSHEPTELTAQIQFLDDLAELGQFKNDVSELRSELGSLSGPDQRKTLRLFFDYCYQVLKPEDKNSKASSPMEVSDLGREINLLDEALSGLDRTKQIVLDLRNFSRLDEAEFQFANIDAGIFNTLNIVNHLAKDKNIQWVTDLQIKSLVPCQPSKLNQVVMNLVVNAIQASPRNSKIEIHSREGEKQFQIQVKDYGSGIAPSHLTRVFDPYFTTKPLGQGTGLGLSLSYQIVQDHKGSITVESLPGQGAEFTVTIPFTERRPLHESDTTSSI